ncbi:hypothetical protein GCM10023205_26170 [Yinghuangia aomiensis]|uniref:Uncharacterized protein n=1 Tax=Yinghuangia aomiensis TaxID=676205 RepID=A0ABP9H5W2_9ACTN
MPGTGTVADKAMRAGNVDSKYELVKRLECDAAGAPRPRAGPPPPGGHPAHGYSEGGGTLPRSGADTQTT